MKLSIIIPMFNVENYIAKCLDSCVSQKNIFIGKDYEIICVDDGSSDNSASITEGYAQHYNGIKVIHQENQGLSGARNKGLSFANGEYIWFVDSDDWIEPHCICKMFAYLKNDLDLLEIQYRNVYEDGHVTPGDKSCRINNVCSGTEATLLGGVHTAAQFCILRRKFLDENGLKFVRGIYHEDVEFKIRALLLAQKVASCPMVCYNYLQRTCGSITASFKLKNGIDLLYVLNRHYNLVQRYDRDVKKAVYNKIAMWMNSILLGLRQLKGDDYKELYRQLAQSENLFYAMCHSGNAKYILEGAVLSVNLSLGLWLHSRLKKR